MTNLLKRIGVNLNKLDQRDLWSVKKEWHLLVIWIIGIIVIVSIVIASVVRFGT